MNHVIGSRVAVGDVNGSLYANVVEFRDSNVHDNNVVSIRFISHIFKFFVMYCT